MARIIDFPDGFTSATEPTTGGAIASFSEVFANDAAYEAVYGAGVQGSFYFNSTLNKLRIHDGTSWRTNERALDNVIAADPTVNDDSDDGYELLSLWLNSSSGALFRAVDVTVGAAVWTELAADAVLDSHINDTAIHTDWSQSGAGTIHSSNYVDNDTIYTHPNHSGEVTSTGDGATVVASTAISNKTLKATPSGSEEVLINDAGTLKKTTTQAIADLGGGGGAPEIDLIEYFENASPLTLTTTPATLPLTVNTSPDFSTLSSNQITLPAGDYLIDWNFKFLLNSSLAAAVSYIYDTTNSVEIARSSAAAMNNIVGGLNAFGSVKFTAATTVVLEARGQTTAASGTIKYGTGNTSPNDRTAQIKITKL